MTERKAILVTGGAGYIGSHAVYQLGKQDERILVLDNLITGFAEAVLYGELILGDTGDRDLVHQVLNDFNVDTVIHFAAHTVVPESVTDPLKYYSNNTRNTLNVLECARNASISHFIFSSTAAVYGIPEHPYASEATPTCPINPYGTSKLMSEWMLRDLAAATDLRYVILRYFNVAGANPDGRIGQSTRNATLLIKVACEVVTGKREYINVFGTDYPTPDGTGLRDYIHVEDLVDAHIEALDYLRHGGDSVTLNCGYGHGYSVLEVLNTVQRISGQSLDIRYCARRLGDPPSLIAEAKRIRETLNWQPRYDNLDTLVKTALDWEYKLRDKEKSV